MYQCEATDAGAETALLKGLAILGFETDWKVISCELKNSSVIVVLFQILNYIESI